MAQLVFISFTDLMTDFAKDHDLHEWEILISSSEIFGSLQMRTAISGITGQVKYSSKYDNIEFVDSLRPSPSALESAYGITRNRFVELYQGQLLGSDAMMDLCCIVDMMINEDCSIMIVMSDFESNTSRIPEVLRQFIEDEFGVIGYLYSDLKNLSDNYGTKNYEAICRTSSLEIPDTFTGRNFEVITTHIVDDMEEVRKNLEAQKVIAANMSADPGEENDLSNIFFNKFTETLEEKIRENLEKKDLELIKELCRQKKIRIVPGASKEFLIDKLMFHMKKTSVRDVEYTPVEY